LAESLAVTLQNLGRFDEAAQIWLSYLANAQAAISALIKGCNWPEASRVVCEKLTYKQQDVQAKRVLYLLIVTNTVVDLPIVSRAIDRTKTQTSRT
jgi:hypothetical protein